MRVWRDSCRPILRDHLFTECTGILVWRGMRSYHVRLKPELTMHGSLLDENIRVLRIKLAPN